jgi:hypothetical protein
MRLIVTIVICCSAMACRHSSKDAGPCDGAITSSELESLFGTKLERRDSSLAPDDCKVSWRKPKEPAFVTVEIEVDRSELRDSYVSKQEHEISESPFAVAEDRQGNGYKVHSVFSMPTDTQVQAARDQTDADIKQAIANPDHRTADPMGDALAKGPSDLHTVEIETPRAHVYLMFSRYSTSREQVKDLTDRIAKAIVAGT